MIALRITGHVPSKANTYRIVRYGGRAGLKKDDEVLAFEQHIAHSCAGIAGRPIFPHPERTELWLVWHRRSTDGRRRDLDNIIKAVKDGLTAGNIWDDDVQVSCLHVEMCYDADEVEWLDIVIRRDPNQPRSHPKRGKRSRR